jgi:hypothetical protein
VDLVGTLLVSKGFTYLFTIIDRTSRWPEAIPIAATTTVDCANALFQGWVSRFGVPAVITSDRGAQFTSFLWATLCSLLNPAQPDHYLPPSIQRYGGTLPPPHEGYTVLRRSLHHLTLRIGDKEDKVSTLRLKP